ncbi:MAG TPA: hypothetical protein VNF51_00905 [Candidatus Paceibacterota bacterium]|nr:hypothetical protein [Candidatus Paceibacterota bacterium]
METLTILVSIILPLLIGYILGKNRDNNKTLFNKKLEIYSDIIYHLSSAKYLKLNLDISIERLKTLTDELNASQERNSPKPKSDLLVNEKSEEVNKKLDSLNYNDELIKLFAPARLLGSDAVINELREYYSLISEYHSIKEKRDLDLLTKKISKSIMELEQLMRRDLGNFRALSKSDILWHVYKN